MRKLICFPFAGAGASFFSAWMKPLGATFSILPVQLPGREKLFAEIPYRSVEQAIAGLLPELNAQLEGATELVIFGHSLGAVLAFELARNLQNELPCALVVSGSPSPMHPRTQRASSLSDEQFLAQVRDFAGYSHPALDDPDMREVLLPTLRSDVEMHEAYAPVGASPIDMPVICVRGDADELVSEDDALAWHEMTSASFKYVEAEGGHMYLTDMPGLLFKVFEYASLSGATHKRSRSEIQEPSVQ